MQYECKCLAVFTYHNTPTKLRCRCGNKFVVDSDNVVTRITDEHGASQWVPESPCSSRGHVLRQMEGHCCGGRQIVDVFECSVHGECTYRNTKAGKDKPQPCLGCTDHTIS